MIECFLTENEAIHSTVSPVIWTQRGQNIGWLALKKKSLDAAILTAVPEHWQRSQPIYLPGFASLDIKKNTAGIQQSARLVQRICDGEQPDTLFNEPLYQRTLTEKFDMLAASEDIDDVQEIAKIDVDRIENNKMLADDLWLKVAWLSLYEEDASLRFRFSYGMEGEEDVASDHQKQQYAADLCEALFPESRIISQHVNLKHLLQRLAIADPAFVERIVYFNAPNGGALFHQDVERGHKGVVYAQLSGQTFWLTLSKAQLLDEIIDFLNLPDKIPDFQSLANHSRADLSRQLEQREDGIEQLLNRTPEFLAQLVHHGHAYWLTEGDMLLLPQFDEEHCAWHTVYCLGEETGEGISFAIRQGNIEAGI